MSDKNPTGSTRDEVLDNYPIEGKNRGEVKWIGRVAEGAEPKLYEKATHTVYGTEIDEGRKLITTKDAEPLGEKSLGEYIEETGDKLGWDFLSEFAQDHLQDNE